MKPRIIAKMIPISKIIISSLLEACTADYSQKQTYSLCTLAYHFIGSLMG